MTQDRQKGQNRIGRIASGRISKIIRNYVQA
jgi:hypothetical protein